MGSALFICDVFLGKDKQRPSPRLILLTLSLSLHILIIHSSTTNTQGQRSPSTPSNATDGSTGLHWRRGRRLFQRAFIHVRRLPSLVSFSSEAGVKVIRRYSLYVAHIQWWRSFDNPHPLPSRYSRISYILPISPKWGGRRARFRSSALFPPATRDR